MFSTKVTENIRILYNVNSKLFKRWGLTRTFTLWVELIIKHYFGWTYIIFI